MKLRNLRLLAATFGVAVVASLNAAEPAKFQLPALKAKAPAAASPASNQALADSVASRLAELPATKNAQISLETSNGVVTVLGMTADQASKEAILKEVSQTKGVTKVQDGINVASAKPAMLKQAQGLGGPIASPMPTTMPPMGMNGPDIEPLPLGPSGGVGVGAPPLPSHAWPTYAPYPNMSRVAYPTAYPHNAFPFIGPYYPFPKVPLGWRSVTLSWEDGHWWLGRKITPQDYWRVKFGY